jgi:putative transposase
MDGTDNATPSEAGSGGGNEEVGYKEWAKEGVAIDPEKLSKPRRFGDLPRRWVVERTFSWLGQNRRMSKDYERLPESSEAFVYVAMTRLMVRRLARS